jgi:hypothetical protein
VWFTEQALVESFVRGTVNPRDDCGLATVTAAALAGTCQAAGVTVTATDRVGNAYAATSTIDRVRHQQRQAAAESCSCPRRRRRRL